MYFDRAQSSHSSLIQDVIPASQVVLYEQRRAIIKIFKNLKTHGGIVGNKVILLIYNDKEPEKSYVIAEEIKTWGTRHI